MKRLALISVVALTMSALDIRDAGAKESPVGFSFANVPGDTSLRGEPSDRLKIIVWYPAPAGTIARSIQLGPRRAPFFAEGKGAQDGPLVRSPARLPFIVVSHGTGGTLMDLAWLCEGLAARGYVVAAVNHPGNNAIDRPTVAGTALYWLRAGDLSRVIDGVLAMKRFGARIDRARIGAAGISLGGYTVLELTGARTNAHLLEPYCKRYPRTPVCSGSAAPAIPRLESKSRALAAADPRYRKALATSNGSYRDERVKAVFSIEPAEGPETISKSLAAIHIPIALVAGLGDSILPVIDNVIPDALALPNARLTLFAKPAGHFTFLIDCTAAGRRAYPAICADAGRTRLAIHRDTIELASSFFARAIGKHR